MSPSVKSKKTSRRNSVMSAEKETGGVSLSAFAAFEGDPEDLGGRI